jgi:TRAP-type mannitol/chloroaromatic compound transport system substrate-binding protein
MGKWLLVGVVALLSLILTVGEWAPAPAQTGPLSTMKMQSSLPSGDPMFDHATAFAQRVQTMSGGRLKIEMLPAGAIVPAFEVLDATSRGVIDGAHTAQIYWVGKHRAAAIFYGTFSFGMDWIDFLGWMYEGGGLELYQEWYRDVLKMNVVAIPAWFVPGQPFGWHKKPINKWADLKGRKLRIPGIAGEALREAGMGIVILPGAEIVPAAERGVIDAAEWAGPVFDKRLGLHQVFKHYYLAGMHDPIAANEILINKGTWEKLTPDLQEIIKATATEVSLRWLLRMFKDNALTLKELEEKHGVKIYATPREINLKIMEELGELAAKDAAKDPFFKKVLESQKAYASLVVPARRRLIPSYEFAADYYWPRR